MNPSAFRLYPSSFSRGPVPLQNLFARPEENVLLLFQIGKGLLEILDSMRDATDIRMNRYGHHASAFRSFNVQRCELILGSAEKLLCFVVLKNHHWDVVQLHRIRQRNDRPMRSFDLVRLVVVDPVSDILKSSLG